MKKIDLQLAVMLTEWFAEAARVLPWRENCDPYRIWLSEIMLQQTRVDTVIGYFNRFVSELPTVQKLAAADEETLMRLWAGLGYYRRMRLLRDCARVIVAEYDGKFPDTVEALRKLPGIGEYTAGAIASIAFNRPVPAVDGNVMRVISRITEDNGWERDTLGKALTPLYPPGKCGEFTQSLMELGALICIPNGEPRCHACPVRELCLAYRHGTIADHPAKRVKNARKIEHLRVYRLQYDGEIAIRKRTIAGVLCGLWELPNEDAESAKDPLRFGPVLSRRCAKHVFTHKEWHLEVLTVDAAERFPQFTWLPPEKCVLPTAFAKLLKSK